MDDSARRVARRLELGLGQSLSAAPSLRVLALAGFPCEHLIEVLTSRGGIGIKGIFSGREALMFVSINRTTSRFSVGLHRADRRDLTTGSIEVKSTGEIVLSDVIGPIGTGGGLG